MYKNRIQLMGFLGSDTEAKFTPTGKAVTNLSLATKTRFLKDNQWQERIEWHRIEIIWNRAVFQRQFSF